MLSNYIHLVSKKSGIDFHMYTLRHQLSTDLFNEGKNPAVIRDLMGHQSEDMSLYYAKSEKQDRLKALSGRKTS